MRAAVIAFTRSGCGYAKIIEEELKKKGWECQAFGKCACAGECGVQPLAASLREWTKEQFAFCDALFFIGAVGIAVRSIAPFVKSKLTDPAVLCMDEQARFVISLLSGHVGGANALTGQVAELLGAVPVITTATDLHGKFAVDVFAKAQGMALLEKDLAKEVSAAVLEGKAVGLYSDFEVLGELPSDLSRQMGEELGISISLDDACQPFLRTLHLVPRIAVLGIGCRKGASLEDIQSLACEALKRNQISVKSVAAIASIDLKAGEPGLLKLADKWGAELITYSARELSKVEYDGIFQESEFVKQVTGVGNVCERAALLASGQRKLIQTKMVQNGVTVAVACREYRVDLRPGRSFAERVGPQHDTGVSGGIV